MYFISHSRKPVAHSNKQIAAQGAWHRPSPAVARTSQSPTCRPAWRAQRRARFWLTNASCFFSEFVCVCKTRLCNCISFQHFSVAQFLASFSVRQGSDT